MIRVKVWKWILSSNHHDFKAVRLEEFKDSNLFLGYHGVRLHPMDVSMKRTMTLKGREGWLKGAEETSETRYGRDSGT